MKENVTRSLHDLRIGKDIIYKTNPTNHKIKNNNNLDFIKIKTF